MYILVGFLNDTINDLHNNCRLEVFILTQEVELIRGIYHDTGGDTI